MYHTKTIYSLEGYDLSVYIWFWYATTKNNWSFQTILTSRHNCLLGGMLVALKPYLGVFWYAGQLEWLIYLLSVGFICWYWNIGYHISYDFWVSSSKSTLGSLKSPRYGSKVNHVSAITMHPHVSVLTLQYQIGTKQTHQPPPPKKRLILQRESLYVTNVVLEQLPFILTRNAIKLRKYLDINLSSSAGLK